MHTCPICQRECRGRRQLCAECWRHNGDVLGLTPPEGDAAAITHTSGTTCAGRRRNHPTLCRHPTDGWRGFSKMPIDQYHRNAGGVCDNCGVPEFAHAMCSDGVRRCPSEAKLAQYDAPRQLWFALVRPARDAHAAGRVAAKKKRLKQRKGQATESDVLRVEEQAAVAARCYQYAILLADLYAAAWIWGGHDEIASAMRAVEEAAR